MRALLPLRRARRPGAVHREGRHRQQVALAGHHHRGHALDEIRGSSGTSGGLSERRGHLAGHLHLVEVGQRVIDRGEVAPHHLLALLAVGLLDRLLDLRDRLLARQHAGDREEAVCMIVLMRPPMPVSLGHLQGVDHVELQLLLDELLLHLARQVVPDLVRAVRGVEQEDAARAGELQDVELLQERELVAGDEVRRADQVGASGSAAGRSAGARRSSPRISSSRRRSSPGRSCPSPRR